MFKKIFLYIALFGYLFSDNAQLIFNDYSAYNKSGFITTEIKMTSIDNKAKGYENASSVGVYYYGTTVALLFDNNFYGGGAIYTSGPDFLSNGEISTSNIGMTYFGGVFGISPLSAEQFHINYNAFLGFGYANDDRFDDTDIVLVFEPEVSLEVNLTNFTKLRSGISWRMTQGVDANHAVNGLFGSTYLSGYGAFPSFNLALIFGEY
jgi:hypothetical protein